MGHPKSESKSLLEKLVRYFEQNIHQLKAPSFNEAQTRQILIDPFFEALGWDVRNKQMAPPFKLEVLSEGRVRTSAAKSSKEQQALFSPTTAVKEGMEEYKTFLEYIADDESPGRTAGLDQETRLSFSHSGLDQILCGSQEAFGRPDEERRRSLPDQSSFHPQKPRRNASVFPGTG